MSDFPAFLLRALVNSLWQLPLWFAAASAVTYALRRARPLTLHRVWVGTLLLQVLFPAICALPDWKGWQHAGAGSAGVTVSFGPGLAAGGTSLPAELWTVGIGLYVAVVLVFSGRFAFAWWQGHQRVQGAAPAMLNAAQSTVWVRSCERFGVQHARLLVSAAVGTPYTWGAWRQSVLLPEGLLERVALPELQTLLDHECAHMQRQDFARNLFYELLLLPLSPHPFAHLTRARLVESREWVCDAAAARAAGEGSLVYARSLLRLATLLLGSQPAANSHAIGVFDANALERRMTHMMQPLQKVSMVRRAGMAAACGVLGLVTAGSAWALRTGVSLPAEPQAAPETGARVIRVSGGVMAGNRMNGPAPVYPADVRAAGIQGTVVLKATISADGKIEDLQVASGPAELRQSALDAVSQWMYRPYLLNGEPTAVQTTITVNYNLNP